MMLWFAALPAFAEVSATDVKAPSRPNIVDYDDWALYDLKNAPEEMHNLYGDPAQAERIGNLKQRLQELQKRHQDENIQPKPKTAG